MPDHCYDILSGYKAATSNPITKGHCITFDCTYFYKPALPNPKKYVTECGSHNRWIASNTLAQAKEDRQNPANWCDRCKGLNHEH